MAGLAVVLIGLLILLDEDGAIDLSFAVFAPVACAAAGAMLLAAGSAAAVSAGKMTAP